MQDLRNHYATLRSNLLGLRHLFARNGDQGNAVGYFDETLEANEFEIALHALCNCLQSAPMLRITDTDIDIIDLLHQNMGLDDGCVTALRRRESDSA